MSICAICGFPASDSWVALTDSCPRCASTPFTSPVDPTPEQARDLRRAYRRAGRA